MVDDVVAVQATRKKKHAWPTITTTMKVRIFPMCSSCVVIAMVVAVVIVEAIASMIVGSLILVFVNQSQQGLANTTKTIRNNLAHH
jgi:hypothetical protein